MRCAGRHKRTFGYRKYRPAKADQDPGDFPSIFDNRSALSDFSPAMKLRQAQIRQPP
jgi:hypothetical protein